MPQILLPIGHAATTRWQAGRRPANLDRDGLVNKVLQSPRMLVETRVLGKKSRSLDNWFVPLPPDWSDSGDGGITLRALITRIVREEVKAFARRERARRLVRVLSDRDILDGAARGKIESGGRPATTHVDEDAAIGAALQGFEDGLYLVVLDGVEQRDLDRQVFINSESRIVFLRLTFLAGA
jgi:hypothetical protein